MLVQQTEQQNSYSCSHVNLP